MSAAQREGITLICVTLSAADDWNVHKKLFDYGFSSVQQIDLATCLPEISLPVIGGVADSVPAQIYGDTVLAVLQGEERQITAKIYTEPFYYAPLLKEQKAGEVEFYLGEQKLGPISSADGGGPCDREKGILGQGQRLVWRIDAVP